MIKPVLFIVCAMFALGSSSALGSPDDEVLDEITIRVLSNDNMPDSVTDISLPNIAGEHEVDLPDNANEAARSRGNSAANASDNAASAAGEAAENAAEAAQDASDNAREHAADAAEKGLNQAPGQNK
jgi:hypothetical protein